MPSEGTDGSRKSASAWEETVLLLVLVLLVEIGLVFVYLLLALLLFYALDVFRGSSSSSSLREVALRKLTLSSDPRVWMGGRIPTRWRRYGRDDRDRRLTFQIGSASLCFLFKKCSFFNDFTKKHEQAIGFKAVRGPPFCTFITVGKVY